MVPVEPISLSVGIATLFTTCIECFEYFKAAKGFEQHFEVLLVKLEWQQERLLVWGDLAGICNEEQHSVGPISEREHKREVLTKRCLDSIGHLLKDTETLKSKYGLRAYSSTDGSTPQSGISSNAIKRFRLRLGRQPQELSVLHRTKWAIHDGTRFQKLVEDIRDLIDGLTTKVPVSSELQEQKVQDDIAAMVDDIQSLHLFQEACKDDYPKWWTAASAAIDASEVATLDNRLADERLEHHGPSTQGGLDASVDVPMIPVHFGDQKVYLSVKMQMFFMLTEPCRAQDSETPCDQLRLGTMSFQSQYSFIAPGSFLTQSAPGYRIIKYIDPSRFTYVDLEKYVENLDAMKFHALTSDLPVPEVDSRYRVKVYIYCPPCACQVAAALDICCYRDKEDFVDFYVRIDHRLMTTCSASVSGIEGLISVIDHLKEKEKILQSFYNSEVAKLKAIDREWLERQIDDYAEEDRLETLSPENQLARIAKLHKDEVSCAAIILLGEADYCIPLMGSPPFPPSESGRLKETRLFRAQQKYNFPSKAWAWEIDYMGTYSPRPPLPPRRPPPVKPDDNTNMQAMESAQRSTKRPRSSISDEAGC